MIMMITGRKMRKLRRSVRRNSGLSANNEALMRKVPGCNFFFLFLSKVKLFVGGWVLGIYKRDWGDMRER
jgi:hypothetical protein